MVQQKETTVANSRVPERRDNHQIPISILINVGDQERLASVSGGLLLTTVGLLRRSVWSAGLLLAGIYLIYRGLSGHCYGYEALGINRANLGNVEFLSESDFGNVPPRSVGEDDPVAQASWESFPTSDPPSWTLGREEDREE